MGTIAVRRRARIRVSWFTAVVACAAAFAGQAREQTTPDFLFARLVDTPAVSGDEAALRAVIAGALPSWAKGRVDTIGNLIVTIGSGSPHLLVAANIDEDGFIVSRVTADGYLRLQRYTSGVQHKLFEQYHYSQPVVARTAKGTLVPGVVGSTSQHLGGPQVLAKSIRTIDDLWVDTGAGGANELAPTGIDVLDSVSLLNRLQPLAGGRAAGVAAQGRANAFVLVDLLRRRPVPPAVQGTLTIAWTTQGVYRGRGLARLAREIAPDRIVLLDRVSLAGEVSALGAFGTLGGGPLVQRNDDAALAAAARAGVTVQPAALPALNQPWPAAKVTAVAVPVLFAQTPVETVDSRDLPPLERLLEELAGLPASSDSAAAPVLAEGLPAPKPLQAPAKSAAGQAAVPAFFTLLQPLIDAYGVSPHESPVREVVRQLLPPWAKPTVDEQGNLLVSFGAGGASLAFVAHTDEIGYEISAIRDDGTAVVRKRGGLMDAIFEARPMVVQTGRGLVPAVMAPRLGYAKAGDAFPAAGDVYVYFGTESKSETMSLGVATGDTLTVRKRFMRLAGQRATGRSMDDRVGDAVMLAALWRIDPALVPNRVTFAWVTGEEVGLNGSGYLAGKQVADYAFAVDTSPSSDTPVDTPRLAYLPLGAGKAVIRGADSSSLAPKSMIAALGALAKAKGIPSVLGANGGGTDAASFVPYGVPTAGLSWPGRYSHSTVEVVDARDTDALVRLIVAVAHSSQWSARPR